ncbi:MAG: MFS transporter [Candidatus Protistobacter heckmanni]|nr:MFS transporter [Candidatus Protistobacter heckmanni]MCS6763708.1 MFS transporter [Candidatus Protistobacter heckmanni]
MIVSGTLNKISSGMGISVPEAGQLITAFAVSCCLGAPLFASLASRVERRLLLTVALSIFALGHAASALADSLGLLLGMRFLSAFGSAIFTPQAAATVSLLVPQAERGKVVGTIFLGWSIASVLGLPLGHAIGAAWGWRAAMSVLGAALVWRVLPGGLFTAPISREAWIWMAGPLAPVAVSLNSSAIYIG